MTPVSLIKGLYKELREFIKSCTAAVVPDYSEGIHLCRHRFHHALFRLIYATHFHIHIRPYRVQICSHQSDTAKDTI